VKLHCCGKCDGIGRKQLYCSRVCQEGDYERHRRTCGSQLSTADVPLPGGACAASTLSPLRRTLLRALDANPSEYWAVRRDNEIVMMGFMANSQNDAQTVRIRRGMRGISYRALQDNDLAAIDVLAAVAVPPPTHLLKHPTSEAGITAAVDYQPGELREQFKETFEMDDAALVAARRRGEEALLSKEFRAAKELYDLNEKKRFVFPSFPLALAFLLLPVTSSHR
jgi:hypothetical protein